ncbi:MAG TPA: class I SAM-dependent methyltransferase [Alphaproteobacteria bacterium]|nr:class I SAM-dependent methyltransferase [Alphaproteobacteria bacterium]
MTTTKQHRYETEIDPNGDSAGARILRLIPPGSRVLELGAGPASLTRLLSGNLRCDVTAVDIDPTVLDQLAIHARSVHALDLNRADWDAVLSAAEGRFDAVIAADVLEHLYDPWSTMTRMKGLLNEAGAIILSVPHAGHCVLAACLMDEDFDYREWGLLDRSHIRFFGLKNVQELHRANGLEIEDAGFVVRTPKMTEFAERWRRLPKDVRRALRRNRFSCVYQVVTRAVPAERARRSLKLIEQQVPEPPRELVDYWAKVMNEVPLPPQSDRTSTIERVGGGEAVRGSGFLLSLRESFSGRRG